MKKGKMYLIALCSSVLMTIQMMANEPIPPVKSLANAKNAIREQIALSLNNLAVENNTEVVVFFKIGPAKKLILLNIEGESADVTKQVENQLRRRTISVPQMPEGNYFLKVRFTKDGIKNEIYKPEDQIREQLGQTLAAIETANSGSVSVLFSVEKNTFLLKKVEGQDNQLVSAVETNLRNSSILPPAGLSGTYKVSVKF